MVDITEKNNTLRIATAQAVVQVSKKETIAAIENDTVPKGNVFAMSKAAGLLGVKKTPELLPDCHPLPIEYTGIDFRVSGLDIIVEVTIKTIYKTGVEVEAMHGASIVALNMYDMLKPIDKGIEIHHIKLLKKRGGKSDVNKHASEGLTAAVIVCSDSISAGAKEDKAGKAIMTKLEGFGVTVATYTVIPDEKEQIQEHTKRLQGEGVNLIIFTGGTGLSPRDVTPDALASLLDRRIPGMEETIRSYGQERTPYAMLSRSIVGTIGKTLVMGLPGSTKGASESIAAVFPAALHVFNVLEGARHD